MSNGSQLGAVFPTRRYLVIFGDIFRLPWWLSSKESVCNAGVARDTGSIPGLGRFPGGRHGNSLQYSCLENPMDRGASWATSHRVANRHNWSNLARIHVQRYFWLSYGRDSTVFCEERPGMLLNIQWCSKQNYLVHNVNSTGVEKLSSRGRNKKANNRN